MVSSPSFLAEAGLAQDVDAVGIAVGGGGIREQPRTWQRRTWHSSTGCCWSRRARWRCRCRPFSCRSCRRSRRWSCCWQSRRPGWPYSSRSEWILVLSFTVILYFSPVFGVGHDLVVDQLLSRLFLFSSSAAQALKSRGELLLSILLTEAVTSVPSESTP